MNTVQEIKWLLCFFALDQCKQWEAVPDCFPPVWVRVGEIDTPTDQPILVLALILSDHLNWPQGFEGELLEKLADIRVLLFYWMIESPHLFIFSKRDYTDDLDRIWRILQQLCLTVLQSSSLSQVNADNISFEHFLGKYTYPITKAEYAEYTKG